jgi:2-dehydro-3-deoxyphosphogalactonate aldolase
MTLEQALSQLPILAILPGLEPDQAGPIGRALVEAGVRALEVPLRHPRAFESIEVLLGELGDRALVGAGTVMSIGQVEDLHHLGARLVVSPHLDPEVVEAAVSLGMEAVPGVMTPTEALMALESRVSALKLFPASVIGPAFPRALAPLLHRPVPMLAVGGVRPESARAWMDAGCAGLGLGSGLYRPGQTPGIVTDRVHEYRQILA